MATTKKKTVTKPVTTKKTTPRKSASKTTVKSAQPKVDVMRSFKRTQPTTPFLTFKPTLQTTYWFIISALVLALGLWVMHLNVQIQRIYDQIEMNTVLQDSYDIPTAKVTPKS